MIQCGTQADQLVWIATSHACGVATSGEVERPTLHNDTES